MFNFQMDITRKTTSIDEISFRFTQTELPLATHLPNPMSSTDSLAYTNTLTSLHHIISQQQPSNPPQSCIQKLNQLKTTCEATQATASMKKTYKTSFRQRIVSTTRNIQKLTKKRGLSLQVKSIGDNLVQKQLSETSYHQCYPRAFQGKQTKKISILRRRIRNTKKLLYFQGLGLQNSMKVRGIALNNPPSRQKSCTKRISENRGNMVHALEPIVIEPHVNVSGQKQKTI